MFFFLFLTIDLTRNRLVRSWWRSCLTYMDIMCNCFEVAGGVAGGALEEACGALEEAGGALEGASNGMLGPAVGFGFAGCTLEQAVQYVKEFGSIYSTPEVLLE